MEPPPKPFSLFLAHKQIMSQTKASKTLATCTYQKDQTTSPRILTSEQNYGSIYAYFAFQEKHLLTKNHQRFLH